MYCPVVNETAEYACAIPPYALLMRLETERWIEGAPEPIFRSIGAGCQLRAATSACLAKTEVRRSAPKRCE
jgi:hypothetical protein